MRTLVIKVSKIFDFIESQWEAQWNIRLIGNIIVLSFLASLFIIHLNILGFLPDYLSSIIPKNHFEAIELAFILLLFFEIQSLVFVLPKSFAGSLIKQFEILSLIMLRQAFKEFKYIEEPLVWEHISNSIYHMLSDALGAVLIFGGILLLKKLQKHRNFTKCDGDMRRFIAIKKILSLLLIVTFLYLTFDAVLWFLGHRETINFFGEFYTVLIFADILIVLVSLRYSLSYPVLFRNSGFAFTTVIIRISLTSPVYINAIIGVSAMVFAVILTYFYSSYNIDETKKDPT